MAKTRTPDTTRTGSRTDVSVYEPLCSTCRLPLDAAARREKEDEEAEGFGWICEACKLPAWGWDWDDEDADPMR